MSVYSTTRLGVAVLLGASLLGRASGQEIEEYQMKAAYLYNFVKFVEWPAQSFASAASPIAMCVLGEDPFAGALDEVVRGKTAGGRAVVVRPVAELEGAMSC